MADVQTATTAGIGFAERAERHRHELHVHCYRMLGSFEEAEDLVQETLLRGWRHRADIGPDDNLRAWLYKIATNACLDSIKAKGRRVPSLASFRTSRGWSHTPTRCSPGPPRPAASRTRP